MKNRQIDQSNLDTEFKRDYLSVDKTVAISSEGIVFKVGDKVVHDGDEKFITHTIKYFKLDKKTNDVLACNDNGNGRISFLNHIEK